MGSGNRAGFCKSWGKNLLQGILAVFFMVLFSLVFYRIQQVLLKSGLENLGYLGVFLLSVVGTASILLPMPSLLSAFLSGAVLNPFMVGLVSSLGASLGELTGYLAGRAGHAVIGDIQQLKKMRKRLDKWGAVGIVILAAIPNPLFDLAGVAAGMMKMPLRLFFLAVWAGLFFKYMLFSVLGAGFINQVH